MAMDALPGGPPPGLEPLEKPPVPPFPSDKELEDISDANTRQDMVQDMRDGILNPYDLTDAQLEFFTKGTGTTREELAELFDYDPPEDEEVSVDSEFDGDNQGPLDPNVPGETPPEEEGPTEEEAFLDSILEGFNNEQIRQQNEETLGELYSSLGFAEGEWDSVLGRKTDEEEEVSDSRKPWWLDGEVDPNAAVIKSDLDTMLKDALDRLPGVGVVFEDGKMKGRILIPIPGLPTYIQGTGLEVDILDDGSIVITQNARNKIDEIKEKIKNIPGEIRDGIDSVIDGIKEAGEEIGDIFTDNNGNIFVNVVDAAGSILRRVSVTVGGLLDGGSGKEGLLGWLLASGAIGSAVDTAKEKYFPPAAAAEGEDDGAGTEDGTGDDGQPQEEPPPEDEKKGPPVTSEKEDPSNGEPPSSEEPPSDDDPTGTPPESPPNEGPTGGPLEGTPFPPEGPEEPTGGPEEPTGGPEEPTGGPTGDGGGNGGVDPREPEEPDEPATGGGGGGSGDDSEEQEPITGGGGMFTGLGGGGSGRTGYMDNLGYGLPQFVAVPYQLKDYNVELNRLINDSLFKGIV